MPTSYADHDYMGAIVKSTIVFFISIVYFKFFCTYFSFAMIAFVDDEVPICLKSAHLHTLNVQRDLIHAVMG